MDSYKNRGVIHIGKHVLYYEDPGIAILVYDGPMSLEEMRILCAIPDVPEHEGKCQFTLCDVRKFGGLDSAARKEGSNRSRPSAIYFTAYVGASFTMKVVVGMWVRATNILQGPKNVAGFFDDYESAKAWFLAHHAALTKGSNRPQ